MVAHYECRGCQVKKKTQNLVLKFFCFLLCIVLYISQKYVKNFLVSLCKNTSRTLESQKRGSIQVELKLVKGGFQPHIASYGPVDHRGK